MHSFEELLDRYVKNMIRLNSVKLARLCRDAAADSKDMEQELYLELFNRFKEFRPDRSSFHTFARHVINGHASTIARRHQAHKRGGSACKTSIYEEEYIEDTDEIVSLIEKIDGQDAIHVMGGNSLSLVDRIERMKEVASLMDSLPEELRQACDSIMAGKSIAETVAAMGISRSTFYYQAIIPLKKIFSEQFFS